MKTHAIWFGVCLAALVLGFQFTKETVRVVEKPVEVVRTKEVFVDRPVEVIKEVPREVVREVVKTKEVPAEIPLEYKYGKAFMDSYNTSGFFEKNEILRGVESIAVSVYLADEIKSKFSETELKDSIELALRKNGVPVKDASTSYLIFTIVGVWNDQKIHFSYSATLELRERIPVLRKTAFKDQSLVIWSTSYTGFAGSSKVGSALSDCADKVVTQFSNAYLAANQK
jgi:hypothetical protein